MARRAPRGREEAFWNSDRGNRLPAGVAARRSADGSPAHRGDGFHALDLDAVARRARGLAGALTMRLASKGRKLAPPALTFAMLMLSLAGLAALQLWAGDGAARHPEDALGLALLRADVDRQPDDARARCRLAREELALGLHADAERTLAPFLEGTSAPPEVRLLALEAALGVWRAAGAGRAGRRAPGKEALGRPPIRFPPP